MLSRENKLYAEEAASGFTHLTHTILPRVSSSGVFATNSHLNSHHLQRVVWVNTHNGQKHAYDLREGQGVGDSRVFSTPLGVNASATVYGPGR